MDRPMLEVPLSTYQIEHYVRADGHVPYEEFFQALKNIDARAVIRARLNRVRLGNFGHCEPVGEGVHELKIDFGPGYRVYFGKVGLAVVMLLCGGSKRTQSKDISLAIAYMAEYKKRKKEGKDADKKA